MLQDCFDYTDWSIFNFDGHGNTHDIHTFTYTVVSYIEYCVNICISCRSVTTFGNSKPWFNRELRLICGRKYAAYKCGDMAQYKQLKYEFRQAVSKAKAAYKTKLESRRMTNDIRGMWQGLQAITEYKTKQHVTDTDPTLPGRLNDFFCRFDSDRGNQAPPPFRQSVDVPPIISEHEVRLQLRRQNVRKAAGPDNIRPAVLKHCADELTPVLTYIFNWSLQLSIVPDCLKSAVVIPVPKKGKATCLNDYRPVALTSVVMKVLEKLVCKHLSGITLETHQFAYRANRSVDDAVSICTCAHKSFLGAHEH